MSLGHPWRGSVLCCPHVEQHAPERVCLPQSVLNRMHVVSIPYALMKVNPLSWIQKVCSYKGEG